jgi:pyruvate carboxylase subunit B
MMGSLMSDLENNLASLNKWMAKRNKPQLTQDELLIKLFNEVEYIWPMLGYPPLVTPYSQYVKNLALMNVMQIEKGEARWSMIADNIWDMLVGNGGRLPGELSPEIIKLANEAGKVFYTGNPQDLYPNALDTFRKEMNEKGWDFGKDDEELFELAMHPQEYRAYKSGAAKKAFEEDLAKRRIEGGGINTVDTPVASVNNSAPVSGLMPTTMFVDVEGDRFKVTVSYGDSSPELTTVPKTSVPVEAPAVQGKVREILAPLEGKFYLTKESSETAIKVGDSIKVGDLIGYVEAMKTFNAIRSEVSGVVVEICSTQGSEIEEDDVMVKIK